MQSFQRAFKVVSDNDKPESNGGDDGRRCCGASVGEQPREPEGHDTQKLRDAVRAADRLSQEGFSDIITLARLALGCLEAPDSSQHLSAVADGLRSIREKAEDAMNLVNCQAEEVGCSYDGDE